MWLHYNAARHKPRGKGDRDPGKGRSGAHRTSQWVRMRSAPTKARGIFRGLQRRARRLSSLVQAGTREQMGALEDLRFDNKALRELPVDDENAQNYLEQRQVEGACFSRVKPTPLENPKVVAFSEDAMALLGVSADEAERGDFPEYFCGNKLLNGSEPAAHCYCGHQFGNFAGQLGDGAAMYLGEVLNQEGERWELQFKGAGKTPYSRMADGRKVLRSSLREFLCSEHMHHLGVPTTRAGTLVTSDSRVMRDQFYNGNPTNERCSVVLRIAPTFIRFGSFEICRSTDRFTGRQGPSAGKDTELLAPLLEYVISTFYPEIARDNSHNQRERHRLFFKEVTERTARLVAKWQCVGFCHGVLNTDNMSVLGLTIDYGPFGFMERFNPGFICNASDDGGRYSYENQPSMCKWNVEKFAEALNEVVPTVVSLPEVERFDEVFEEEYMRIMRNKLGISRGDPDQDKQLLNDLLETMKSTGADMTRTFRSLAMIPYPGMSEKDNDDGGFLDRLMADLPKPQTLANDRKPRLNDQQIQLLEMLANRDPNMLAQIGGSRELLEAEKERTKEYEALMQKSESQKAQEDQRKWQAWVARYQERLANEVGGLDANGLAEANTRRVRTMNANNPKYILRNWVAQQAIDEAERGNYKEVNRILELLKRPYAEDEHDFLPSSPEQKDYDSPPPEWAENLVGAFSPGVFRMVMKISEASQAELCSPSAAQSLDPPKRLHSEEGCALAQSLLRCSRSDVSGCLLYVALPCDGARPNL